MNNWSLHDLKISICQRCELLSKEFPRLKDKIGYFEDEDNSNINPLRVTIEEILEELRTDQEYFSCNSNSPYDSFSDLITVDTLIMYYIENSNKQENNDD